MKLAIKLRWLCWLCCFVATFGHAAEDETHLLIVTTPPDHPAGSHLYAEEAQMLEKHLRRIANTHVQQITQWPPSIEQLASADGLVFYSKPIGDIVLHPDHRHRFLECMERGAGLVAIHWSTGVGYGPLADHESLRDEFRGILGGWFRRPPGDVRIDQAAVEVVEPDHAILRGVQLEPARDEFYLRPVMHDLARPFLRVTLDGQSHPVGWTFERSLGQAGNETLERPGRSVGISLGHFHERFQDEDFQRLLVNAILWSVHREVPANGGLVTSKERASLAPLK